MALTKSTQAAVSSQTCTTSVTGSGFLINYGISGIATITNGATGPTTPCGAYLDFSVNDSTWVTGPLIGLADTVNNSVTIIPFSLGIGAGGDWAYYRVRFTGNTVQDVTVKADASTTSAI